MEKQLAGPGLAVEEFVGLALCIQQNTELLLLVLLTCTYISCGKDNKMKLLWIHVTGIAFLENFTNLGERHTVILHEQSLHLNDKWVST